MATRTLLLTLAILVPFLPLGSCFGIGMLGVAALPHKGVIPEDSRAFGFTRSALPLQSAPWHSSNQQQQQQQQHVRVRKRHTPPTRSLLSHDGNHAAAAAVEARDLLPTETRLASANLSESEKKCLMWHDGLGKLNCHQFSLVFGNRRKLWIWQWWNKNEITVRGEHNIWKKDVLRCEGTKWVRNLYTHLPSRGHRFPLPTYLYLGRR